MRFSLRLNNDLTLAEYVVLAQAAEAAGFDQFWVSHDLFLRSAPVILSAVALETKKIEIGSCILNPYTINPAELAMLAATLDELSGCRFNLGLAAGAGNFLNWIGVEQRKPLATMRETIKAVRALLSGEQIESGHFVNWTQDAYLRFKAPRVTPIYLGAMSPNMLRLAGELCEGVLPLLFPPEHYYTVWPLVQEGVWAKRDPALGELDFAACFWASLDADPAAARKALAQKVAYYGQSFGPLILERVGLTMADFDPIQQALTVERDEAKAISLVTDSMLAVGVVGGAKDLIARLEPLVQAGVRHLSFGPPLGPDPLAAVELLGRDVLPYFRSLFPA